MHHLPVICTEWEQRQPCTILQITYLEVLEAIAYSHRLLHLRTDNDDSLIPIAATGLPEVAGLGLMEHTVFAGNLKALYLLKRSLTTIIVLRMNEYRIILDGSYP